jgi:hypothetical protein
MWCGGCWLQKNFTPLPNGNIWCVPVGLLVVLLPQLLPCLTCMLLARHLKVMQLPVVAQQNKTVHVKRVCVDVHF